VPAPHVAATGSPVESVDRALRVLEALSDSTAGLTLEELAMRLAIPKSSAHRTLAALRHRDFVMQPQEGGRYLLGTGMLAAAFGFYERLDLRALVRPLLVRLRDEFNETVHMGVLDGADVVYLDKVESSHSIKMSSRIGGRNPAHATGVGKALLAWAYPSDEAVSAWAHRHAPLGRATAATLADPAALAADLERTRARGFAVDLEESERGVRCVAAPVMVGPVVPAAAVSVAAPRDRLSMARMRRIGPRVVEIVEEQLSPRRLAAGSHRDGVPS
jgi:IclR family transcriptional regulator, acetate operon repressor